MTYEGHVYSDGRLHTIISESHINLAVYPKERAAGVDIFSCGQIHPVKAIPPIVSAFRPRRIVIPFMGKRG